MSSAQTVAIIIPAFGRADLLRKALGSAITQDFDPERFEVIVVDSSPDDGNARVVEELRQTARCRLRCFRKEPEGPGPSRNLGVRESVSEFLALLDSDCEAAPTWLKEGLASFTGNVGIVQGKVIPDPAVPHSVFNRSIEVHGEGWCYETANIFYRRAAFEQAGGFRKDRKGHSQRWAVGGEDVDLAWQVKRLGWDSRFAENALVTHVVVKLPAWRWIFQTRIMTVPLVVGTNPEIRRFFYKRYFFDQAQALLLLGLAGAVAGAAIFTPALVLTLPYLAKRATEPSRTLSGPARILRVVLYLPRDMATLGALVVGSIRYRTLLL